jgi:hypothetical protein
MWYQANGKIDMKKPYRYPFPATGSKDAHAVGCQEWRGFAPF